MATIVGFDTQRYESILIQVPMETITTDGEVDNDKALHALLMHIAKKYAPHEPTDFQLAAWEQATAEELSEEMDDLNDIFLCSIFEENVEDLS